MAGDDVALMQQLHDEHAGALWGYCLRLTGHDRARAEDVVQETLLRAWRQRSVLDSPRAAVRSWLFTVARNIVIDEWRTSRARHELAVADVPEVDGPGRPDRPAAAVLGGRRGAHQAVAASTARCCWSATTVAGRCRRPRSGSGFPRARSSRGRTTRCAHCGWRWRRWGWGHDLRARGPRRLLRARSPVDDRAPGVRAAPGGLRRVRALGAGAGRPARPAGAGRPRRPREPRRGRAGARDAAARAGPGRTTGRSPAHAGHRRSRGCRGRRGRRRAAGRVRRPGPWHPLGRAVDAGRLRPGLRPRRGRWCPSAGPRCGPASPSPPSPGAPGST